MRHLRRTKRAYAAKRQALLDCLQSRVGADHLAAAGLAVLLKLPQGTSDVAVAREALTLGMAPSPLSAWYASPEYEKPLAMRKAASNGRLIFLEGV